MLQNIIVILIGIAVAFYLLKKLFRCFLDKKTKKNRCDDCPGCILHPKNKD
jgi:uncharacterized membrane protein YuzA (DUF378 family)